MQKGALAGNENTVKFINLDNNRMSTFSVDLSNFTALQNLSMKANEFTQVREDEGKHSTTHNVFVLLFRL